ncbi:MAG TPA: hypothetical protein VIF14_09130 [Alphaproteobacteria bacterium]|jgi:hypothetical protein
MFLAHDRNRFSRELKALAGRAPKKEAEDQTIEKMRKANQLLDKVVKPLFEHYAAMVRQVGRTSEFKVLPGSVENYPPRSAVADFLIDLSGVPGLAEYYLRLETEGGEWRVTTRPRLDGKGQRYDVGEVTLPANDKLPSAIEGALQQFIRLTF